MTINGMSAGCFVSGGALAGPDPKTLLDAVRPETLCHEILQALQKLESVFVVGMNEPLGWFKMRFGQSFAVLTACRMLQTCRTGIVESKRCALLWAEQTLDPTWRELIRKTWAERTGVRYGEKIRQPAEARLAQDTVALLAYARSLSTMP